MEQVYFRGGALRRAPLSGCAFHNLSLPAHSHPAPLSPAHPPPFFMAPECGAFPWTQSFCVLPQPPFLLNLARLISVLCPQGTLPDILHLRGAPPLATSTPIHLVPSSESAHRSPL